MNQIKCINDISTSYIECEEYFPLRVVFDPSIGNNRFAGFYCGDDNLLEFALDRDTEVVRKFQIVLCKNFQISEVTLEIPSAAETGSICLAYPQHNDCDTFLVTVYKNCIQITISSDSASEYYAAGQVLFGVDSAQNLVSVIVTDLSEEQIAHTIFELQAE